MKALSTVGRLLGDLEHEIMAVVWKMPHAATIRVVCDALARKNVAYTTVMTVMNRLAEKGILERDEREQPHRYTARHSESDFFRSAAGAVLHRIKKEYGPLAIACFVAEAEKVSKKNLRALRKLRIKV